MADTTHSYSARNGGKFARFRCAGAPRNWETGWRGAIRSFNGLLRPNLRVSWGCSNSIGYHSQQLGADTFFAVPTRAVAGLDREANVDVPLQGGTSGTVAHPSDSCAVVFSRDCCRPPPRESVGFSSDGRLPHIPSLVRIAAWEERCSALSTPGSADAGHARLSFPVAKAQSARKTAKRSAPSGIAGASSESPMPSRVSGPQCSLTCKNLQAGWPPSKSVELRPFQRRAVRALRCRGFLLLRESRAAQRFTKLALCLEPVQASVASVSQANSRGPHQKATRLPANLSTNKLFQFWTGPEAHAHGRKILELIRVCGSRGDGVHQPPRSRLCPGADHSTHPSRVPWSCHCGARDESAEGSDDSSWGILELAATRKGTSPSPPRSFPNFAKGHRDGHRSPGRGQNRGVRMRARCVVPDLRDNRVCSEEQWPRLDMWLAVARTVPPKPQVSSPGTGKRPRSGWQRNS